MSTQSPWNPPKANLAQDHDDGGPIYAGFWRRFAAAWLDFILVYIAMLVVAIPLVFLGDAFAALAQIAMVVVFWLYFALQHSSARQATLGKRAFGIKVTDGSGERISFLRATGRYFATWVSYILLAIGYLMAAFTGKKQALHDMMANTVVVRSDATAEAVQSGGGTMKLTVGVWLVVLLIGPIPMIGILAAIAIPAYQDYLTRAQLTESVLEARNARTAVETYFAQNRALPAKLEDTGYRPGSPHVASVRGRFTGPTIEIRVEPTASVRAAKGGAVLLRSPAAPAPFEWTCSGDGIPGKYLPASCR